MMTVDDYFFLRSKVTIPPLRPPLVERPALTARLDEGVKRALLLVSAPAGFGKTTVLAQWAAQAPHPVAWLSLDQRDDDPARLFPYLAHALAAAGVGPDPGHPLLHMPQELPPPALVAALVDHLQTITTPFILVLDDYQLLRAPAVHQALEMLLDYHPPSLHLVISTRADPPFPLARMRARRQLVELRAADLRFSAAEVTHFFQQVMGLELSTADLETLSSRTEGWIAGLQLAALALQDQQDAHAFVRRFSGSHRFIFDYLAEEVVNRQPPPVRHFLLATSLLERLTAPLCEAVTAQPGAQQLLQQIEAANLFLVPLDDQRRWYRYHHLFAELLQARLHQSEPPATIAALHRRAAAWYEDQGQLVEAVEHMLASDDMEQAAALVERHGHEQWGLNNAAFLRLVGRLPIAMLRQRPALGIYHAWALIIYGRLAEAQQLLQELATTLEQQPEHSEQEGLRAFVDLLLAYTPVMLGQAPAARLPDAASLAKVPDMQLAMRNSADVVYAYLLYLRGDLEQAADHLLLPVRRDLAARGTTAIPLAISRLAQIRQIQGQLPEAERLCRHYLAYVAEHGHQRFYVSGNLDLVLGDILRERNDLEAAAAHIAAGLQTNEPWHVPHAAASGALALARLQQAQGQPQEALQTLAEVGQQIAGRTILPALQSELDAFQARLWLQTEQLDDALSWAARLEPLPPLSFVVEPALLSLARVWQTNKRLQEAQDLLARLAEGARAGGRGGRLLEIQLLQALVLDALGRRPAALERLHACVQRAAPAGYLRLFLDEGRPLHELLVAYLANPSAAQAPYARTLLDAFPDTVAGATTSAQPLASPLPEPLTPRELEVLQLICQGLSNRDIAQRLTITVSTVKKHAGNIYGKLGVESRAQAMVRARELGLVPPVHPAG